MSGINNNNCIRLIILKELCDEVLLITAVNVFTNTPIPVNPTVTPVVAVASADCGITVHVSLFIFGSYPTSHSVHTLFSFDPPPVHI